MRVMTPAAAPVAEDLALARCKCGHDKRHTMVSANAEYTIVGWCMILIGISAKPTAVSFVCRTCAQRVDRVTDPAEIATIRIWG